MREVPSANLCTIHLPKIALVSKSKNQKSCFSQSEIICTRFPEKNKLHNIYIHFFSCHSKTCQLENIFVKLTEIMKSGPVL